MKNNRVSKLIWIYSRNYIFRYRINKIPKRENVIAHYIRKIPNRTNHGFYNKGLEKYGIEVLGNLHNKNDYNYILKINFVYTIRLFPSMLHIPELFNIFADCKAYSNPISRVNSLRHGFP